VILRCVTPSNAGLSALEIVSRLCESDFARQAKAADFLQSTWDAFLDAGAGRGEDKVWYIAQLQMFSDHPFKVLDTLLASFTALVSKDIGSLTDLVQRDQSPSSSTSSQSLFTSTLFSLLIPLSPDTDPLLIISQSSLPNGQLKNLGITKADQALLKTLHVTMTSKARIFPSSNLPVCGSIYFVLQTLIFFVIPDFQRSSSHTYSHHSSPDPHTKYLCSSSDAMSSSPTPAGSRMSFWS
jgi:hypothetical protein